MSLLWSYAEAVLLPEADRAPLLTRIDTPSPLSLPLWVSSSIQCIIFFPISLLYRLPAKLGKWKKK